MTCRPNPDPPKPPKREQPHYAKVWLFSQYFFTRQYRKNKPTQIYSNDVITPITGETNISLPETIII